MRKKVLALILTGILSVMSAVSPIAGFAAEVTEYYDVNFDQAGDTDTAWKNSAGDMYFGYCSAASALKYETKLKDDAMLGSKAAEFSVPQGSDYRYFLGQMSGPGDSFDNAVTWYELSFRFEGGITSMLMEGNGYIFYFTDEGALYIGGVNGHTVNNYTFEAGKWYHLVVAVNNVSKWGGTDTKFYAWANGTFLTTPETSTGCTVSRSSTTPISTTVMNRFLLAIYQNPSLDVKVYLDNLKVYKTDNEGSISAYNSKAESTVYGGSELSSDSLTIENDVIKVASGTKLSAVKAALSNGSGNFTFCDGTTAIADADLASVDAIGKTIYSHSKSGQGYKKYTIESNGATPPSSSPSPSPSPSGKPKPAVVKSYYDVDFDQPGETDSGCKNKADSGMSLNYCSAASAQNFEKRLVEDKAKGNKAEKIIIPKGSGYQYYLGQMSAPADSFDNCITWYEISFKYEGANVHLLLEGAGYPLNLTPEGVMYIGGVNGNIVNNFTPKTGEWYHLVIAADNINKYRGSDTMFYAWVNGTFLTTAETPMTKCTISRAANGTVPTTKMNRFLFNIRQNTSSDAVLWLDDVKMYTTTEPIKDSEGNFCFDPNSIFDGAELMSEVFKVDDDVVYAPADETLGELLAHLNAGKNGMCFYDGESAVAEDELTMTAAKGKIIYARSDEGIGSKKYTISDGNRLYDAERENAEWKKADGTPVTAVSALAAGDAITLTLDFINNTKTAQEGVLVLAAYNNGVLSGYQFTDISVPIGRKTITSEALTIDNTSGLEIRAFIWKGNNDFTPEMTGLVLK